MSIFNSLNTSASALTAQRLRMDVVSSNIANAETTRGKLVDGKWQPYQRKLVEIKERDSFSSMFSTARNGMAGSGVQVTQISDDKTPFKLVYDPAHPDADVQGYVKLPNVDPLKEMTDLISSSRSYEANVTVFNASKSMLLKALEIGK
ncbi:flagellar basal body rod protein FlgC [Bacillus sp. FJAT-42376]|uniref:flagellar basal body rod protein FlgC n=1 Tax=Bacillus sp. FJAT-42376 TaxID=2014076 RepID=UPI000F504552|nr:flagellar basal body rod protein FlgC [Bacillus sp. FJAT-42376]AZB42935.1 flagellar basal body rod protein FlgC [Bacillus sp. FJAT-42376]